MRSRMNHTKRLQGSCSECGGSIEFPAELVGTMTQCPHCRKQTELLLPLPPDEPSVPRKAIVWSVVAVVILALGVIVPVAGLKHFEKLAARQKGQPGTSAGLDVSVIALEKGQGTTETFAVGTVVNTSARKRSGITVELDLLDAGGQKIGVARGYKPVLEPGAKWQFKLPVGDAKAVSARLASVKEAQ